MQKLFIFYFLLSKEKKPPLCERMKITRRLYHVLVILKVRSQMSLVCVRSDCGYDGVDGIWRLHLTRCALLISPKRECITASDITRATLRARRAGVINIKLIRSGFNLLRKQFRETARDMQNARAPRTIPRVALNTHDATSDLHECIVPAGRIDPQLAWMGRANDPGRCEITSSRGRGSRTGVAWRLTCVV